jgi:hypothetical protein
VIVNLLPEILLIVTGILLSIFIPILWRKRIKWLKMYNDLDNENPERKRRQQAAEVSVPVEQQTKSPDGLSPNSPVNYNYEEQSPNTTLPPNVETKDPADPVEEYKIPDLAPKLPPSVFILKEMFFLFLVMLAGSLHPSFTSAPYMLLCFILSTVYGVNVVLPPGIHCIIWSITSIYTGGLIVVYDLSRFRGILDLQYSKNYGKMIGFIDTKIYNKEFWPSYASYVVLIFLYVFACSFVHQYLCKYLEFRHYINSLPAEKQKEFHIRTQITKANVK